MAKRITTFFLAVVLAVGLLPLPAMAEEAAAQPEIRLEPGTYVEHEAIAYVVDGGARARTFSLGGDLIDNAQTLMEVDADAAEEALGDEVGAGGEASPAARARMLSLDDASDAPAGRLVLVRDESKTTEELIAALQAQYPDLKTKIFGAMQRLPLPQWGVTPHRAAHRNSCISTTAAKPGRPKKPTMQAAGAVTAI